jgi:phosphohistidine swiveling domain-containing protein/uncharacterized protein YifE (UPF0438 family)
MKSEIIKNWFKGHKWTHYEDVKNCPIWLVWSPMQAHSVWLFDKFGVGVRNAIYFYKDGDLGMYMDDTEYKKAGEVILSRTLKDYRYLGNILDKIEESSFELLKFAKKFKHTKYQNFSNQEILELYKSFFAVYDVLWMYGQAVNYLEHGQSFLVDELKQKLIKKLNNKKELNRLVEIIVTPEKYSFLQKEENNLVALVKNNFNKTAIDKHWKKYADFGYGWSGPAYSLKYFKNRAQHINKYAHKYKVITENQYIKNIVRQKQSLFKNYKLTPDIIQLAKLAERIIYLKGLRVDASYFGYSQMEKMFLEIGRRFNLSLAQVQYIIYPEMECLLKTGKIDFNMLSNRRKFSAMIYMDGFRDEISGSVLKYIAKNLQTKKHVSGVSEIKGTCGFPGLARGRVVLINTVADFHKMNVGDVLVSHVTDPRFVPVMKKASAIVADVGGITCHAAIVAREMKKPCVIGTQTATEILKDGDFVEVDADEGLVRKLR